MLAGFNDWPGLHSSDAPLHPAHCALLILQNTLSIMSSPNLKIHNDSLWEQVQTPLTKGLDSEIRRQSRHSTHGHPEGTSQSPGASQEIEGPCQSHELTLPHSNSPSASSRREGPGPAAGGSKLGQMCSRETKSRCIG